MHRRTHIRVLTGAASLAAFVMLGAPHALADEGDDLTSTGDAGGTFVYAMPAADQADAADNEATADDLDAQYSANGLDSNPTLSPSETTVVTPDGCEPGQKCIVPKSYNLPGTVLHDEGAGNPCTPGSSGCSSLGHKYYTCAAASTRNAIQTLTGTDKGEWYFESNLGIKPGIGLAGINRIPFLLNGVTAFKKNGSWKSYMPTTAGGYYSHVVGDTYGRGPETIQKVATQYLPYFGGYGLTHFDTVYGYNGTANTVAIDEEWNPQFTFGYVSSRYTNGNPAGSHNVYYGYAFNAVHHSPSSEMVY